MSLETPPDSNRRSMLLNSLQELARTGNYPYLEHYLWFRWIGSEIKTVVALGHNWDRQPEFWPPTAEQDPQLSIASKVTALAALVQYQLGLVQEVIFSGGQTARAAYDDPQAAAASPTEAQAMYNYVTYLEEGRAPSFVLEEQSVDTLTNATEVKSILAHQDRVSLSSVEYHLHPRALQIFNAAGVEQVVATIPSDSFLREVVQLVNANPDSEIAHRLTDILPEVRTTLAEFDAFMGQLPFTRAHGPEYHLMARVLQRMFLFLSRGDYERAKTRMSNLANKRRQGE